MMFDQKVLVTGASGFIGKHLVGDLLKKKIPTVGAYLHHSPTSKPNFSMLCTDLRNANFAKGVLEGVGAAVHLAWQSTGQQLHKPHANQEMTKRLIAQLERNNVKKFVYLSSIGASPSSDSEFLREKYECERIVLGSRIREKIIVRSSIVYSGSVPEDVFLQYIIKQLQIPWFFAISHPKSKTTLTHVQDICSFLVDIISQETSVGSNIIEIAGDEEVTIESLYRQVAHRFVPGSKFALRGSFFKKVHQLLLQGSKTSIKEEERTTDLMFGNYKPSEEFLKNNPLADFLPTSTRSFKSSIAPTKY